MRKGLLLFLIVLCFFIGKSVSAKEAVNVSVKSIDVLEKNNTDVNGELSVDGLEFTSNVVFYDVGDYIKYKVTLINNDNKDYQIKDITDNNSSENIIYEYDGMDKIIKAGKEEFFIVTITYNNHIVNDITKLSNGVYSENDDVNISLKLVGGYSLLNSSTIFVNPTTGRNIILIFVVIIFSIVSLNMAIKNKRVKTMIFMLALLLVTTNVVKADEPIMFELKFKQQDDIKLSFMDKNWRDIETNNFTKIKFTKIDADKNGAYDISEAKDRSILEWIENGTLYIGSYHNVYAPIDSSYLFSSYIYYDDNDSSSTIQSARFNNVTEIDFGDSFMTNYVMNMSGMFCYSGYDVNTLSIIGLENWDTSLAINMSYMFFCTGYGATTWSIGDLSNWNTWLVSNMRYMFYEAGAEATAWNIGNLSDWDTSKVTNMQGMFKGVGAIATTWNIGDLSGWDVSSVTIMSDMFNGSGYEAATWNIGDLSDWNTANVTDMSRMFNGAGAGAGTWSSIGTLNIYATSIASMFKNCPMAKATLNINNNPTSYNAMFNGVATVSGSSITVNYKNSVSNIDNIIATKSDGSNVVKGNLIS